MIGVFSALGFLTDNPETMVPVYLIFFIVLFGAILIYNKIHHRKKEPNLKAHRMIKKILGIILFIISFILPAYVLRNTGFPTGTLVMISVMTLVLIIVAGFAVYSINTKKTLLAIIGYVLLIIVAYVPGRAMQMHDTSYSALGTAYYLSILVAILAWWGVNLATDKK